MMCKFSGDRLRLIEDVAMIVRGRSPLTQISLAAAVLGMVGQATAQEPNPQAAARFGELVVAYRGKTSFTTNSTLWITLEKGEVTSMAAILNSEPIEICNRVEGIPAELGAIIMRALNREPIKRYSSAGHFRDSLRANTKH